MTTSNINEVNQFNVCLNFQAISYLSNANESIQQCIRTKFQLVKLRFLNCKLIQCLRRPNSDFFNQLSCFYLDLVYSYKIHDEIPIS